MSVRLFLGDLSAVSFVEIIHTIYGSKIEILPPNAAIQLTSGFDAAWFVRFEIRTFDGQGFGKNAAIHWFGRFDAEN